MSLNLAVFRSNLLPVLSTISSSAKQHGLTEPMGLVSKLTQGSTQNLSCGMFTAMPLALE